MADANSTTAEIQSEVIDYRSFSSELTNEISEIDGALFAIRSILEELDDDPDKNDSTICGVKGSSLITLNHARKNLYDLFCKIDSSSYHYIVKKETGKVAA